MQQVVVLEEQVSSHGGLGGRQTEPFALFPSSWRIDGPDLRAPEGLHRILHRALDGYQRAADSEPVRANEKNSP